MAHINAEYNHPDYDITVEVLEPQRGESDYSEGRKVNVNWDFISAKMSTNELRRVIKWLDAVRKHITANFDRKGRLKANFKPFDNSIL